MVIAETPAAARDGAERVRRRLDAAARRDGEPRRRRSRRADPLGRTPRRTCAWTCEVGDAAAVDTAFARAAHVVRLDTWVQRVTGVTMEPRAAVGVWDPASGRYTVHAGAGGLGRTQTGVAGALGVPESAVRVMAREVGGQLRHAQQLLSRVRAGRLGGAAPRPAREVDGRAARGIPRRLPGPRSRGARRAGARCRRDLPRLSRRQHQQHRRPRRLVPPAQQGHGDHGARSTACPPWRCTGAPSSRTRRPPRRTAARDAPRSCSSWSG